MLLSYIYTKVYGKKYGSMKLVEEIFWQSHYISDRRHFVWYLMVCTGFTCNKSYKNSENSTQKKKKNPRIIDQKLKLPCVQRALSKQCI